MIQCAQCVARVSPYDRFCGTCGTPLAALKVSSSESGDGGETGRSAIRRGANTVSLRVVNPGVVTGAVKIDAKIMDGLPPWIDRDQMAREVGKVYSVEPNGSAQISIPLQASTIEQMYVGHGAEDRATELAIPLQTTTPKRIVAGDSTAPKYVPRQLTFTLVAAREPWLQPNASTYPFLPIESLESGGHVHEVRLWNESTSDIRIKGIHIEPARHPSPTVGPEAISIEVFDPTVLIQHNDFETERVPAGASIAIPLTIVKPDASQYPKVAGRVGWLSANLVCRYVKVGEDGSEFGGTQSVRSLVEATIGTGPTIVPAPEQSQQIDKLEVGDSVCQDDIRLGNPGDLPVRITKVKVLRTGNQHRLEDAPAQDWLKLNTEDLAEGMVILPGEIKTVRYEIHPDDRPLLPPIELQNTHPERVIRISHDGLCPPGGKPYIDFRVRAHLGTLTISNLVLGIDFGTSNSMVCVKHGQRDVKPLRLEHSRDHEDDQLASLMFYKGGSTEEMHEHFVFGHQARALSESNPSALVRSIKSVIARTPTLPYSFQQITAGGVVDLQQFRSQALLNLFITELRKRAERAVTLLTPNQQQALGLNAMGGAIGTKVRFTEAVFTHPVNIDRNTKQALMTAAHAAGLNTQITDLSQFLRTRCVDEASSAILAYVKGRTSIHGGPRAINPHQDPTEIERVLCYDMGGGTTDIAAMEVHGLPTFNPMQGNKIQVELCEITGDSLFGGDDIDEVIAEWLLDEVSDVVANFNNEDGNNVAVDMAEIKQAFQCSSFTQYHQGFQNRCDETDEALVQAHTQLVWQKAERILNHAETIKKELSEKEVAEVTLAPAGWPDGSRIGEEVRIAQQPPDVGIVQDQLNEWIEQKISGHVPLIESTVANSDWQWSQVDTILFTGQSVRLNAIRKRVLELVSERRVAEGVDGDVMVVAPGDGNDFCPKQCVSEGAVLWSMPEWVEHRNRTTERLTADLQKEGGFWGGAEPIPGLERNTPFPIDVAGKRQPIEVQLPFQQAVTFLKIYRNGRPYMLFEFPGQPTTELTLLVYGPADMSVVIDGIETRGVPQ